MTMTTLAAIAGAVHGKLSGSDAAVECIATDSRTVERGQLFFALKGERHDSSAFLSDVMEKGAAGAVVSIRQDIALPQIEVPDTRLALGELAGWWRRQFRVPVVGITGSNGKTTVKEMTAAILRVAAGDPERVLVTLGNYNNEIGLPLTLLWLRDYHAAVVLEMGAGKPGDIAYLAGIAAPDVAVITNAYRAHLKGFGTLERVAETKGELFAALAPAGTAVVNRDDSFFAEWWARSAHCRRLSFGLHPAADYRATGIETTQGEEGPGLRFTLHTPQGNIAVRLAMAGRHNVLNALAACAVAMSAGATTANVVAGLAAVRNVAGRLRRVSGVANATLYDDTYNANPGSVRAALEFLATLPGERWFVFGGMAELGPGSEAMHREVGEAARELGISRLWCAGPESRAAAIAFGAGAQWCEAMPDLIPMLLTGLNPQVTVLVKGSRSMGMERVVQALATAGQETGGAH